MSNSYPTLDDIRGALSNSACGNTYDEPYLTDWASWLHENWHRETIEPCPHTGEPVRTLVFGNIIGLLWQKLVGPPVDPELPRKRDYLIGLRK